MAPAAAGEVVEPRASVIVDGRAWSDAPAELSWTWVADSDAVETLTGPADATGPTPSLVVPEEKRVLALIARGSGVERRAFVALASPPGTLSGPLSLGAAALPLAIDTVTASELTIDARRALDADPADADPTDAIAPGAFARFTATVDGDPLIRWMSTAGTWFELDRHTADWAAGDLRVDGDEIVAGATAVDPGWVTILALALGAPGETAVAATDLAVGTDEPGLWTHGRFVPTDVDVAWSAGDQVRGTLVADDGSPIGLRLTDAVAEPAGDPGATACGPGPFDPNLLLVQACARSALDGAEVVVTPEPAR
ncbi:MAG: hypothetical protein ABMB14_20350 [Myxococcota bacterium]